MTTKANRARRKKPTKAQAIVERLREPSTWAGISALGLLFGLPPETVNAAGQTVGAAAAIAAIVMAEKAKRRDDDEEEAEEAKP